MIDMKLLKAMTGPFEERPFYEEKEIESIAVAELRKVQLLPARPEPIRIDRFIEKRFDVVEDYEDLPSGILGYTRFGSKGAEAVIVSRSLEEEGTQASQRRIRTTLAHEAGHILLHAHLFALNDSRDTARPFASEFDLNNRSVLCRNIPGVAVGGASGGYDGRWWEYQANQAIGALLLPRSLVLDALDPLLASAGLMGIRRLESANREEATDRLSVAFDVNPVVARHRLDRMFPKGGDVQLTL